MKAPGPEIDLRSVNDAICDLAILTLPVGSAAQDAAVASIGALTLRHKVLEEPGLRALESLCFPVTSRNAEATLKEVKRVLSERNRVRG